MFVSVVSYKEYVLLVKMVPHSIWKYSKNLAFARIARKNLTSARLFSARKSFASARMLGGSKQFTALFETYGLL